jgi:hypothetical protein
VSGDLVLGSIAPEHSSEADATRRIEIDLELPAGVRDLCIVAGTDEAPGAVLRLQGLRVARRPSEVCA